MGRIAFILFLIVAMPIGIHHAFEDPQVGAGFKYLHSVFTAIVALPTLLTVFTICASVEIAARLRGGTGVIGWLTVLPWRNPVMLGAALSFIMLGFGGAGRCDGAHPHHVPHPHRGLSRGTLLAHGCSHGTRTPARGRGLSPWEVCRPVPLCTRVGGLSGVPWGAASVEVDAVEWRQKRLCGRPTAGHGRG